VLKRQAQLDALLEKIEQELSSSAPFLLPNFRAFTARTKILEGNREAATSWLDNYFTASDPVVSSEASTVAKVPFHHIFQLFTTARAYILLAKYSMAESILNSLLELSCNFRRPLDIAEAQTLLAVVYWQTGRKNEAQIVLETALLAMQPHGFIRIIAGEGKAAAPVLKRILAKTEQPDYSGQLDSVYVNNVYLTAYAIGRQRPGIASVPAARSLRLSRQQKLMLALLAAGYKREDIVDKTGLSLNTVKSHLRMLYQKLDANNAADAVARAHELGLLV
jgi:LuxR family maltose regulon positive regulatory protein